MQTKLELFEEVYQANSSKVSAAIEALATQGSIERRGAVFTRIEVVDFILDLAGYTEDQPLHLKRILEPSFGGGDFLFPIVDWLLAAWKNAKVMETVVGGLGDAIRAVELHRETFATTRLAIIERIRREGIEIQSATALADRWLIQGDFLLSPPEGR